MKCQHCHSDLFPEDPAPLCDLCNEAEEAIQAQYRQELDAMKARAQRVQEELTRPPTPRPEPTRQAVLM